jgi:hypothetical protein
MFRTTAGRQLAGRWFDEPQLARLLKVISGLARDLKSQALSHRTLGHMAPAIIRFSVCPVKVVPCCLRKTTSKASTQSFMPQVAVGRFSLAVRFRMRLFSRIPVVFRYPEGKYPKLNKVPLSSD